MKRNHPASGSAAIYEHITQSFRVTYAETDRMGFCYYANYLRWFEIGRIELLRSLGANYLEWEDVENIFLPVRNCEIHYKIPARFDDLVRVRTQVSRLTAATITMEYSILREETELAIGMTEHPFMDNEGRIRRVGAKLLPTIFPKPI